MIIRERATTKYLEFSKNKGCQHAAGQYAMYRILELVEMYKCTSLLEIGFEIGTLPSLILENTVRLINYVSTEANAFCLESLKNNLSAKSYNTLEIYENLSTVLTSDKQSYDFVIIDGKFDNFNAITNNLSKNAIIVVEGDRQEQEQIVQEHFPHSKFVHLVSAEKIMQMVLLTQIVGKGA